MENLNLCDIVQESIEWCEGTPNYAGMQRQLAYTAASNILSWPEREKTESGRELAAYKDKSNFELKADKKWHVIDVLTTKSTSGSDSQGEEPSTSQLNKLSLVIPGSGEKQSNAATYINNIPCVFLVKDMDDNWRVCGCKRWAAEIKAKVSQDWGQGSAGSSQTTITVEAPDTTPYPVYKGTVETDLDPVVD